MTSLGLSVGLCQRYDLSGSVFVWVCVNADLSGSVLFPTCPGLSVVCVNAMTCLALPVGLCQLGLFVGLCQRHDLSGSVSTLRLVWVCLWVCVNATSCLGLSVGLCQRYDLFGSVCWSVSTGSLCGSVSTL